MSCTKCDKKAYVNYKDKNYCTWYCAKKGQNMIFDIAMVGFTWLFIIGFVCFSAYICSDDNGFRNSKAYRDLDETILNRNEG